MTNRECVTLHILWRQAHCDICSYDQQAVSHITHFVKGSLIMANRLWVTFIAHFVKGILITSFPMMHSLWVLLHILWEGLSSHLFLWQTGSEWHCTCLERQSDHIFSIWTTGSESDHCTFCEVQPHPMTNREWVTLHILWKFHHIFPYDQQFVSNIAYIFCERQSHHISHDWQQEVSDMANLLKAVSSDLFWQPTGSQWHCTFYERESHQIFSYDEQVVSDIAYLVSSHLFPWPTGC